MATGRTYLDLSERSADAFAKLRAALKVPNRTAFLIAMAWGFKYGDRVEESLKKSSATQVRHEYLRDEDYALMGAIQLATTGSPDSLLDLDERYLMAEQFAEGGMLLLKEILEGPGDLAKAFAAQVIDAARAVPGEPAPMAGETSVTTDSDS